MDGLQIIDQLDAAHEWLREIREDASIHQGVGGIRRHWPCVKAERIGQLSTNTYRLPPLKRHIINVVKNICERLVWTKGDYATFKDKSIPRGCSMSLLLAAIHLIPLDHAMKNEKQASPERVLDYLQNWQRWARAQPLSLDAISAPGECLLFVTTLIRYASLGALLGQITFCKNDLKLCEQKFKE